MKSDALVIDYYYRNLLAVYYSANFEDEIRGEEWYSNAKDECRKISRETGYSLKRVIWAMAALSNNKQWETNVDLTRNVCFALRRGIEVTGHFGHLLDKAQRILVEGEFTALNGPKVIPFAQAIYQPWSDAAVVDRWIWRAAHSEGDPISPWLSPARLHRVAIALRRVARTVRRPVTVTQAVIWTVIRRESSMLAMEG